MGKKKRSSDVKVETKYDLLIEKSLIKHGAPEYLKEFNESYKMFCDLSEQANLTEDELQIQVAKGAEAAIIVASKFDFTREEIHNKKQEYVKFARDMLYMAGGHPNNNADAMIYLIKALYGQTYIAYNHTTDHKVKNIEDGNEWVDYLEKNTNNRVLKAYALTLRAYQYIVNGEEIGMSVKDRLNKSEKDLIYATKWDVDNYFAFFALGLIYIDNGNSKYNVDKAISNFKKVLEYEDTFATLDKYVTREEKERAMTLARRKIEYLKGL